MTSQSLCTFMQMTRELNNFYFLVENFERPGFDFKSRSFLGEVNDGAVTDLGAALRKLLEFEVETFEFGKVSRHEIDKFH